MLTATGHLENSNGSDTAYSWDFENRLLGVSLPGEVDSYIYYANGLRQTAYLGRTRELMVWDDQNLLIETNAAGSTKRALHGLSWSLGRPRFRTRGQHQQLLWVRSGDGNQGAVDVIGRHSEYLYLQCLRANTDL